MFGLSLSLKIVKGKVAIANGTYKNTKEGGMSALRFEQRYWVRACRPINQQETTY
jgi:hypothetical protein